MHTYTYNYYRNVFTQWEIVHFSNCLELHKLQNIYFLLLQLRQSEKWINELNFTVLFQRKRERGREKEENKNWYTVKTELAQLTQNDIV